MVLHGIVYVEEDTARASTRLLGVSSNAVCVSPWLW